MSRRAWGLQNPVDCAAPESLMRNEFQGWHVLKFTSHGHGVNAFAMAWNVGNHWDKYIPVVASRSSYRFGSREESCDVGGKVNRGWTCHMSPLSEKCALSEARTKLAAINLNSVDFPVRFKDWCRPRGRYDEQYGRCICDVGFFPSDDGSKCENFLEQVEHQKPTMRREFIHKWQPRFDDYHQKSHPNWKATSVEHWISRKSPGEVYPGENPQCPSTWTYEHTMAWLDVVSKGTTRAEANTKISRLKLKHGFFWWILQHIWILHKRAPKREEMELLTMQAIPAHRECVAVHVRRADSCHDDTAKHRSCPKLEVYAKHVDMMREKYYTGSEPLIAYMATDDPSAVDEAREISARLGMNKIVWKWQDIDRKRYVNGEVVDSNEKLFTEEAMNELYFDLWAMSRCRVGMVSSLASSVAWTAYALQTGRFGYYVPFVSVDLPFGHPRVAGYHMQENVLDGSIRSSELDIPAEREALF